MRYWVTGISINCREIGAQCASKDVESRRTVSAAMRSAIGATKDPFLPSGVVIASSVQLHLLDFHNTAFYVGERTGSIGWKCYLDKGSENVT